MKAQIMQFIAHHWILVSLFGLGMIWVIWEESRYQGGGRVRLSAHQVTHLINNEGGVVVDMRDRKAYDAGHITKALHVPFAELRKEGHVKLEKYRNSPLILVCSTGQRGVQAMHYMQRHGYQQIYVLTGGMTAWDKANFPVVKG